MQPTEEEGRNSKAKRGDSKVDVEASVLRPVRSRDDRVME
jgi:hypothetical protein